MIPPCPKAWEWGSKNSPLGWTPSGYYQAYDRSRSIHLHERHDDHRREHPQTLRGRSGRGEEWRTVIGNLGKCSGHMHVVLMPRPCMALTQDPPTLLSLVIQNPAEVRKQRMVTHVYQLPI